MKREVTPAQKEYRRFEAKRQRTVMVLVVLLVAILLCVAAGFKIVNQNAVLLLLALGVLGVYILVVMSICQYLARKQRQLRTAAFGSCEDMPRTGLFAELWDEFEDKQFEGWFEGKIQFAQSHNNCIDLILVRNRHEFAVFVDADTVSVIIDEETEEPVEMEMPLSDFRDLGHLISAIQDIIRCNS